MIVFGENCCYLTMLDVLFAVIPLLPSLICVFFIGNFHIVAEIFFSASLSIVAFITTSILVPIIAEYTLKRGLSGKDLGKKGTKSESDDIPEAVGLVSGISFLVCTIVSQLIFAKNESQLVIYNSALFSICFMIFLGYMDDTLDLKWRYKLILPTIASLPLLLTYSGSTSMHLPSPFNKLLMNENELTTLGQMVNLLVTVDTEANGAIVELKWWFLLFMGLQAVFCTNSINILAGINGLECGQAYVIACSLLFFKLFEISRRDSANDNALFAIALVLPFIGSSLGLLRHNWYPSKVFVGDTFCYFSGMTFAVIGIHSHFSKTLLMLFVPQIINFLYSVPQLFKLLPCPRHRLPQKIPDQDLLKFSGFACEPTEYRWLKVRADDTICPNCTLLNLLLRMCGPMHEKSLCILTLSFQIFCSIIAFYIRYYVLDN